MSASSCGKRNLTVNGDFYPVGPPGPERKVLSDPAVRHNMAALALMAQLRRSTEAGTFPLACDINAGRGAGCVAFCPGTIENKASCFCAVLPEGVRGRGAA